MAYWAESQAAYFKDAHEHTVQSPKWLTIDNPKWLRSQKAYYTESEVACVYLELYALLCQVLRGLLEQVSMWLTATESQVAYFNRVPSDLLIFESKVAYCNRVRSG